MILKEIWYPKDFIIFRKKNNKLTLLRLNYLKEFEQVIANIYNYSGFYTRNNKIKVPSNSIGDFINLTNQFNISVGLISENMFKKIKHLEFANNHNYFKYTLKKSSHSFEEYCYIIYLFKHKLKITPYANIIQNTLEFNFNNLKFSKLINKQNTFNIRISLSTVNYDIIEFPLKNEFKDFKYNSSEKSVERISKT